MLTLFNDTRKLSIRIKLSAFISTLINKSYLIKEVDSNRKNRWQVVVAVLFKVSKKYISFIL